MFDWIMNMLPISHFILIVLVWSLVSVETEIMELVF